MGTRTLVLGIGLLVIVLFGCFYTMNGGGGGTWISPIECSDPNDVWSNEEGAYDGNTQTFARQQTVGSYSWSSWLHLILDSPIKCSKLRFFANIGKFDSYDRVRVEVRTEGDWVEIYKGDFVNSQWNEISFDKKIIDVARICFYNREGIPFVRAELHEFEFWRTNLLEL